MHCGVGDYTAQLSRALSDRTDIDLSVLTTRLPSVGAPPFVHRTIEHWRKGRLHAYAELLGEFQPDIVHIQYPTQGYETWSGVVALPQIARRITSARIVQTWHEYPQPIRSPAAWALLALGASADALIYVRPDYEQHLHGPLARLLSGTPRHFVPNGAALPAMHLPTSEREQLRSELAVGRRRMISFFGFAYRHKGVHLLFDIANPATDHIVLIGELSKSDPYHASLLELACSPAWHGRVTICGFLAPEQAARILAASDAAVFPFEEGGGVWNSSVHAALAQGTFTLVTSRDRTGYIAQENVYYAPPGRMTELRAALERFAGKRGPVRRGSEWTAIADRHMEVYRAALRDAAEKP